MVQAGRVSVTKRALAAQFFLQERVVAELRQFADVAGDALAGVGGVAGAAEHGADLEQRAADARRIAHAEQFVVGAWHVRAPLGKRVGDEQRSVALGARPLPGLFSEDSALACSGRRGAAPTPQPLLV